MSPAEVALCPGACSLAREPVSELNHTSQYLTTVATDAVKKWIERLGDHLADPDPVGIREGSPRSCHLI